jgi:hypothetical protein
MARRSPTEITGIRDGSNSATRWEETAAADHGKDRFSEDPWTQVPPMLHGDAEVIVTKTFRC